MFRWMERKTIVDSFRLTKLDTCPKCKGRASKFVTSFCCHPANQDRQTKQGSFIGEKAELEMEKSV